MSEPTITREAVLAIHSEAIARFGGIDGVRATSSYLQCSAWLMEP